MSVAVRVRVRDRLRVCTAGAVTEGVCVGLAEGLRGEAVCVPEGEPEGRGDADLVAVAVFRGEPDGGERVGVTVWERVGVTVYQRLADTVPDAVQVGVVVVVRPRVPVQEPVAVALAAGLRVTDDGERAEAVAEAGAVTVAVGDAEAVAGEGVGVGEGEGVRVPVRVRVGTQETVALEGEADTGDHVAVRLGVGVREAEKVRVASAVGVRDWEAVREVGEGVGDREDEGGDGEGEGGVLSVKVSVGDGVAVRVGVGDVRLPVPLRVPVRPRLPLHEAVPVAVAVGAADGELLPDPVAVGDRVPLRVGVRVCEGGDWVPEAVGDSPQVAVPLLLAEADGGDGVSVAVHVSDRPWVPVEVAVALDAVAVGDGDWVRTRVPVPDSGTEAEGERDMVREGYDGVATRLGLPVGERVAVRVLTDGLWTDGVREGEGVWLAVRVAMALAVTVTVTVGTAVAVAEREAVLSVGLRTEAVGVAERVPESRGDAVRDGMAVSGCEPDGGVWLPVAVCPALAVRLWDTEHVAARVVVGRCVPVGEGEALRVAVHDGALSVRDVVGVKVAVKLPVPLGVSDGGDRVGVVLNEGVGRGEGLGVRLTVETVPVPERDRVWTRVPDPVSDREVGVAERVVESREDGVSDGVAVAGPDRDGRDRLPVAVHPGLPV